MVRVTVCELPAFQNRTAFEERFRALERHTNAANSDILVLPEMPFFRWLPAVDPDSVDVPGTWDDAVESHWEWLDRLDRFGSTAVVGSCPALRDDARLNEGFLRTVDGLSRVHVKGYLPDEPGFREASWYEPGDGEFSPVAISGLETGFLICTDLWASDEVRSYGREGVELLVNPRVTELRTVEKWLAGARTMSVLAGAYLASSNRAGEESGVTFGGSGWITGPDGAVLARTDADHPFLTVDISPDVAQTAKSTYPRDALSRPRSES